MIGNCPSTPKFLIATSLPHTQVFTVTSLPRTQNLTATSLPHPQILSVIFLPHTQNLIVKFLSQTPKFELSHLSHTPNVNCHIFTSNTQISFSRPTRTPKVLSSHLPQHNPNCIVTSPSLSESLSPPNAGVHSWEVSRRMSEPCCWWSPRGAGEFRG